MNSYLLLASVLLLYVIFWFIISIIKKRNDVADIAWGVGFVLLSWISFFISSAHSLNSLVVNVLVTLWGLRLAWHIYSRNKGKPEDFRYLQWRMEWKNFYLRSFLQVFLLQGFFLYVIALPVFFVHQADAEGIHFTAIAGAGVWLTGFYLEVIADYQLVKFKSVPSNKGKIMRTGLWKYSRHPNYFGEVVQWWGIYLFAVSLPNGWLTIVGPLTITYLIRYVSGVPMLERKYKDHPEFKEYSRATSIFFPWFLKS